MTGGASSNDDIVSTRLRSVGVLAVAVVEIVLRFSAVLPDRPIGTSAVVSEAEILPEVVQALGAAGTSL